MNVLPLLLAATVAAQSRVQAELPKQPAELPTLPASGEDYRIETSADSRYEEMKAELDERFEKMFALKAELDRASQENEKKWQEYWEMHNAYEKQLKRLIAIWVMDSCR